MTLEIADKIPEGITLENVLKSLSNKKKKIKEITETQYTELCFQQMHANLEKYQEVASAYQEMLRKVSMGYIMKYYIENDGSIYYRCKEKDAIGFK